MSNGEDMFDACLRIAKKLHELGQIAAEARRQRRLKRRRDVYAIRKRLGIKPKPKNPPPEPERPRERAQGCECHFPNATVPCRWCEEAFECELCGDITGGDCRAEGDRDVCVKCAESNQEEVGN